MNTVSITGRLVEDIRLNATGNGVEVANGKIASQRPFKNKQGEYEADFVEFTVWRGKAPIMAEYIKKGDFFGITGRLETKMRERDGVKYPEVKVIVEDFDFPQRPKSESNQQNNDRSASNQQPKNDDPFADNGQPIHISDDSLPF